MSSNSAAQLEEQKAYFIYNLFTNTYIVFTENLKNYIHIFKSATVQIFNRQL